MRIGGGPATVRDFLAADLVDSVHLVQVPLVLGHGARLWDGLERLNDRYVIEAASAPRVRAAEAVQRTPRVMLMGEAMAFRNGAQPIGG